MNIDDRELYWLAGLLEGEGSFCAPAPSSFKNGISINLEMTDKDVVERVAKIFDTAVFTINKKNKRWKQSYSLKLIGSKAAAWMIKLKPLMGARRQARIESLLVNYVWPKQNLSMPPIEELRKMRETLSLRQIAKLLGCSHQRVFKYLKTVAPRTGLEPVSIA